MNDQAENGVRLDAQGGEVALVSIQEAVDMVTTTGKLFRAIVPRWERGITGERTRKALA
ncbi:MAG TPA: hypothetical protein VEI04_13970 [Syntrophobacteria bacterium]|nr:hypothetical protein [Syntrophobacteria bacterium]